MRKVVLPWNELAAAEAAYGKAAESLGDIDLLRIAIKELTPLSEDKRAKWLAEFPVGPWNEYTIRESIAAGKLVMPPPGWRPTHDTPATKGLLVKLRRGLKT